ncbi:hypothetical protein [Finegoldia magna]|uniref:Uncharacterized protein n=1 Tax=Finegoldia magna (strain ATCC 29328 / DSM 20472 / WAL 2508) TaxID=334413 RepID=B0S3U0_FINM2|nr:hypothetical protein [Finegoldia magna]UEA69630.1 hypothetical protein LK415_05390 [Finegoldia magna]BAG09030.1 conserved hypothetical protein [Finegoldia magna ATCC 29328]
MKKNRKIFLSIVILILISATIFNFLNLDKLGKYIDFKDSEKTAHNIADVVKGQVTEYYDKDGRKNYYALNTDNNEKNSIYLSSSILITEDLQDNGIYQIRIITPNKELLIKIFEDLNLKLKKEDIEYLNKPVKQVKHSEIKNCFLRLKGGNKELYDGSILVGAIITKDKGNIEEILKTDNQYYNN